MAEDQTAPVPADWYPDPYGVSEMRWWDGHNWTDSIHPPAAPAVPAVPAHAVPARAATPAVTVATPVEQQDDPFSALGLSTASTASAEPATHATAPVAAASVQASVQAQPQTQEPTATEAPPLVLPTLAPPTPGSLLTDEVLGAMPAHAPTPVVGSQPQEPAATESAHEAPIGEEEPSIPSPAPTRLPSRRELRLRSELEADGLSAFSEQTVFPTTAAEPEAATPSAPDTPAPDAPTPSAFDWLPGAGAASGLSSPQTAATATSGFPPLGTKTESRSRAATPVQSDFADEPTPVTDAWSRKSETSAALVPEEAPRSTATRKSTTSGWIIALMPLIAGVLSVAAVKGQENYPRYLPPTIFKWWMLVAVVIGVLYLATILFAVADRSKLDWAGYNRPAHWVWAILTAPVYLLVRTISIKRETGRISILLGVWLLLAAVLVGVWFVAGQLAPDLIAGYTLPFLE